MPKNKKMHGGCVCVCVLCMPPMQSRMMVACAVISGSRCVVLCLLVEMPDRATSLSIASECGKEMRAGECAVAKFSCTY